MAFKTVDKVESATMRKKRSIAKSRAASLKAHRTIARMKEARGGTEYQVGDTFAIRHPKGTEMVTIVADTYRRALPNPWLDMK